MLRFKNQNALIKATFLIFYYIFFYTENFEEKIFYQGKEQIHLHIIKPI